MHVMYWILLTVPVLKCRLSKSLTGISRRLKNTPAKEGILRESMALSVKSVALISKTEFVLEKDLLPS